MPNEIETRLIHDGEPRTEGAVGVPIFQSSTFLTRGDESGYDDIRYIRLNNTPNHVALHAKLASIEGGEAALVTASGMAAITTSILAVAGGGHVLAQRVLYGGTHDFFTGESRRLGLEYDFIDADDPPTWDSKLRANTKAIYVETMTNPLLDVADHAAIVAFAREHGLVTMIDNTFASPINFRPIEHGYDLSLHSATKYLNGHDDVVAGAVIGSRALVRDITHLTNHLGGTLDPHACVLLHRGLKTLALRVRQQNTNALALARFLWSHPAVARVNYPGLETHPRHARARELFDGFGGMLSFEAKGGAAAAQQFLGRVRIALHAPSLGGVETLVSRPAAMSHVGMSAEDRAAIGLSDALIRVSVGIENERDLIADFGQALA
jgi:cystathionine beta-lyase/cystathionine gamma-synthase